MEVSILPSLGNFEVLDNGKAVISGEIKKSVNTTESLPINPPQIMGQTKIHLDQHALYTKLNVQGYHFGPEFQGIIEAHSGTKLNLIGNLYHCRNL